MAKNKFIGRVRLSERFSSALLLFLLGSGVATIPLAAESFGGVELPDVTIQQNGDQNGNTTENSSGNGATTKESAGASQKKKDEAGDTGVGGSRFGSWSSLFGGSTYAQRTRKERGIDLKHTGESGKKTEDKREAKIDQEWDSVIWVDTFYMTTNGYAWNPVSQSGKADGIKMAHPAEEYEKMIAKMEKERQEAEKAAEKAKGKTPRYYVGGYCDVSHTTYVSKSNEFASVDCLLNFGKGIGYRQANVFLGLYPDYKREILIGLPVYITFRGGSRANFDGVVLNQRKTSLNIASWIDNQKIERLVSESALSLNDIAYRYASSYMQALHASKVHEETNYTYVDNNNSNGGAIMPITTRNVEPPKPAEYLISAGIEFLSSVVSTIGRNYLSNTGPLFRLDRGSRVYVEGVVSFDKEGLAKKFGLIEEAEQKKAKTNNQDWIRKREDTIRRYDRQGGGGSILQGIAGGQ